MRGARTLAWIAATGCCALGAPAARAAIVDDAPGAAARGPGQVEVFVRGADGAPLRSALSGGHWSPWERMDGGLSSGPAAVGVPNRTDLFVRGGDGQLYHRVEIGTRWAGWEALGGALLSAPTAQWRPGVGYLDVYARWSDNEIFQNTWIGSGWTGWAAVPGGGLTVSAPAVTARASGFVDIAVRGTDDHVYTVEWNGSAWGAWTGIGGTTITGPALVSRKTNTLDLFTLGPERHVHWRTFDGTNWSSERVLPGVVSSGAAAVADGSGRIYLFARTGGDVSVNVYSLGRWLGWAQLHPAPAVPPAARCSYAAGHMSAKTHSVVFGRRPHVSGRVVSAAGQPLAGAGLLVRTARGRGQAHGVVKANGTYRVALPRGHNRTVQVVVAVPSLNAYVCSAKIAVRVRAGVRLSASRAVRPGGTVHFTGRLLGGPLPRHGKVVELQAFDRGQWRTFASARARGKHRRFRSSYHLTQTFGPRTFRFRARVRREADYPYVLGYSRSVRVRVL